jgi:hypothetical protein
LTNQIRCGKIDTEREVKTMMMYRLIFKDGTFGPWTADKDEAIRNADFFHAKIEEKPFLMDEKTFKKMYKKG